MKVFVILDDNSNDSWITYPPPFGKKYDSCEDVPNPALINYKRVSRIKKANKDRVCIDNHPIIDSNNERKNGKVILRP